jgi:hypothetical protein
MRNIIPVVMAGVLGIYGLIVAVVLIQAGSSPIQSILPHRHHQSRISSTHKVSYVSS